MAGRDFYAVLGVERDVEKDDLKKAYRKLAIQYHPDRNPGDHDAEERFKEVAEAYEVLADPERRQIYDRFGVAGLQGQGYQPHAADDIFSHFVDMFGGAFEDFFGGGRRRQSSRRGQDQQVEVRVTLREAATGVDREIPVRRDEPCGSCHGTGAAAGSSPERCPVCAGRGQIAHVQGLFSITTTCPQCRGAGRVLRNPCPDCRGAGRRRVEKTLKVKIPPGVDSGSAIRVTGAGGTGGPGASSGDLYVVVNVDEDEILHREGDDLVCEVSIDVADAVLGRKMKVPGLLSEVRIEVPAGAQPRDTVRVSGEGMPRLGARGRGDLWVRLDIVVPRKPSRAIRKLYEQIREESGGGEE